MKCGNCGKKLNEDIDKKACSYCGKKIKWKGKMDLTTIILLVITIVLFIVLLFVVYNKFIEPKIKNKNNTKPITTTSPSFDDSSTDLGNTMGNLANGGIVVEDDDYIYFLTKDKKLNIVLYKQSKEDNEIETLLTGNIANFNIVYDTLFYTDELIHLKSIGLRGNEKGVVKELGSDENYNLASVYGDWIYYVNSQGQICRIRPDASKKETLSQRKAKAMTIVNKKIFALSDDDLIFTLTIDDKNEVVTDIKAKQIISHKNWIYYLNDEGLYRALADDLSKEKLLEIEAISFNLDDSSFYITDGEKVFQCDLEGEGLVELFEFKAKNLYLADNKLYLLEKDQESLYVYNIGEEEEPSLVI